VREAFFKMFKDGLIFRGKPHGEVHVYAVDLAPASTPSAKP
jgi:hypothetical protein